MAVYSSHTVITFQFKFRKSMFDNTRVIIEIRKSFHAAGIIYNSMVDSGWLFHLSYLMPIKLLDLFPVFCNS